MNTTEITYTLTLDAAQMRLVRLALANWDGYDMNLRTTVVTDEMDDMRYALAASILDLLA